LKPGDHCGPLQPRPLYGSMNHRISQVEKGPWSLTPGSHHFLLLLKAWKDISACFTITRCMCNSTHTQKKTKQPISQLIKTVLVTLARNLKAVGSSEKKTTKHHLFGSSAKITKQKQERKTMTRKESKIAQGKKKICKCRGTFYMLSTSFCLFLVLFLGYFKPFYLVASVANHSNLLL